jgi:uncharacterized protein YndB with AHSA1/START domain
MTDQPDTPPHRIERATRFVAAPAHDIFELLADPASHALIDGSGSVRAPTDDRPERLHLGSRFGMKMRIGVPYRITNEVVEFEEGRRIAWKPASAGEAPAGHLWRWELEPVDATSTRVTHTYDWTGLTDPDRLARARATGEAQLRASVDRLAALAESAAD